MQAEGEAVAGAGVWAHLIEAVGTRRDRTSFVTLFEHFAPRVKTFALRSGASAATAEELAQETMLTVWRKAESFVPGSASAAAWIFAIARNLQIDTFRHERRLSHILDENSAEFEGHEHEQRTPEHLVMTTQMEGRVREALAQLPPEQIRVIELFFFGGKTHCEIEEQLQIPLGTVKSRLRLALSRVRALLDRVP